MKIWLRNEGAKRSATVVAGRVAEDDSIWVHTSRRGGDSYPYDKTVYYGSSESAANRALQRELVWLERQGFRLRDMGGEE